MDVITYRKRSPTFLVLTYPSETTVAAAGGGRASSSSSSYTSLLQTEDIPFHIQSIVKQCILPEVGSLDGLIEKAECLSFIGTTYAEQVWTRRETNMMDQLSLSSIFTSDVFVTEKWISSNKNPTKWYAPDGPSIEWSLSEPNAPFSVIPDQTRHTEEATTVWARLRFRVISDDPSIDSIRQQLKTSGLGGSIEGNGFALHHKRKREEEEDQEPVDMFIPDQVNGKEVPCWNIHYLISFPTKHVIAWTTDSLSKDFATFITTFFQTHIYSALAKQLFPMETLATTSPVLEYKWLNVSNMITDLTFHLNYLQPSKFSSMKFLRKIVSFCFIMRLLHWFFSKWGGNVKRCFSHLEPVESVEEITEWMFTTGMYFSVETLDQVIEYIYFCWLQGGKFGQSVTDQEVSIHSFRIKLNNALLQTWMPELGRKRKDEAILLEKTMKINSEIQKVVSYLVLRVYEDSGAVVDYPSEDRNEEAATLTEKQVLGSFDMFHFPLFLKQLAAMKMPLSTLYLVPVLYVSEAAGSESEEEVENQWKQEDIWLHKCVRHVSILLFYKKQEEWVVSCLRPTAELNHFLSRKSDLTDYQPIETVSAAAEKSMDLEEEIAALTILFKNTSQIKS